MDHLGIIQQPVVKLPGKRWKAFWSSVAHNIPLLLVLFYSIGMAGKGSEPLSKVVQMLQM